MAVIYMEKAQFEKITVTTIKSIVEKNCLDLKYEKLNKYYVGEHAILSHKKKDSTAPNNKIVNNMAKYVTDTAVGYFVGKPVVYSSINEQYHEELQHVFDYNDEQDHNTEIAKKCSICGSCFEMLYLDEESEVRFAKVEPQNGIMIYETGLSSALGFIRIIFSKDDRGNSIKKVEFWNSQEVWFLQSENDGTLKLIETKEHYFGDVPFVEYINNEERIGDFEGVISVIDAYNKVQSNTANLFQYNDEAILKVSKLGDVKSQDVKDMKEKGAIILEDGGDVSWMLKVIEDTALENYKNRLRQDMHIFSNVPNLTDEAFGGNLSGVAVSYKLWGLEQICAIKERKFKRGLQRRIELITNILNITTGNYSFMDIDIQFRRNKPQNILEISQIITMLSSELSRETRLKMLPTIDDVQDELDKLNQEREKSISEFGAYDNLAKALSTMSTPAENAEVISHES